MSEKIVQLNEEAIKGQLKELVQGSVEEMLNELPETETEKLTQAARYERNEVRQVPQWTLQPEPYHHIRRCNAPRAPLEGGQAGCELSAAI